jgi:hypothetical protein
MTYELILNGKCLYESQYEHRGMYIINVYLMIAF